MSDSDSFIQEVTEEVRRDKMFAAWKKYGPWVIAAIVLVIAGTAGRAWWLNSQMEAMREQGGAYLAAQRIEDIGGSAEAFDKLAAEGEGNYAALAGLRAGAAFAQAADVDRAVAEYEAVAAMPEIDPRLKSLAELRVVMVQADKMDPDEMLERLGPQTVPDALWRPLALEFQANAYLRKGDREAAIAALNDLIEDSRSPVGAKARAEEMIAALGGVVAGDASPEAAAPDTASEQ